MPSQRKKPRNDAGKRFFLKALERRKASAISSVMNILYVMDAVLAVLEDDLCIKRTGVQLIQLMFATAVLSSTVLPHTYISPGSYRPTMDNNPWKVSGTGTTSSL